MQTVITAALLGLTLGMFAAKASAGVPTPLQPFSGWKAYQFDSGKWSDGYQGQLSKPVPAWINDRGGFPNNTYHRNHMTWTHFRNRICKGPEYKNFSDDNASEQNRDCRKQWIRHVIQTTGSVWHPGTRSWLLYCEFERRSRRGYNIHYLPTTFDQSCIDEGLAAVRSARRLFAGARAAEFGEDLETGKPLVTPESLDPWAWSGPIRIDQ